MLRARAFALATLAILLFAACSTGETQVEGGGTPPTGPTGTGSIPTGTTGATATGPAGTTAGAGLGGAVQLDLSSEQNPTGASMYSCDGVEGTWTYDPGTLDVEGVEITMEPADVNMSGGTGTLVISGEVTLPGAGGAGFTDTVDLRITGTADAPTMEASGVKVEATGALQGVPIDLARFFPEKVAIPIVEGAPNC
ncbi:MAG TPA: hypothetical protein VFM81_06090 [Actinomycetota bacterium]|nr:hypothetical protein [Actinomycetota bacterium]